MREMKPAAAFEDLTSMHLAHDAFEGEWYERFDPAALAGVEPVWPLRFKVLREEWAPLLVPGPDDSIVESDTLVRTILEIELVSA